MNMPLFPTRTTGLLLLVVLIFLSVPGSNVTATAAFRTLSTNLTIVNLGTNTVRGRIEYFTPGGARAGVSPENEKFVLPGNGGNRVLRQYSDLVMANGVFGSRIFADQPVGSVVQLIDVVRPADASVVQGATTGLQTAAPRWFLPQVARRSGSSMQYNSQIVIQNAATGAGTATISFYSYPDGFLRTQYSVSNIQPGAAVTVDLEDAVVNLGDNWFGSAVVEGSLLYASSRMFGRTPGQEAIQLLAYNGTPSGSAANPSSWYVPLFTSRLPNGLSTPVIVQNVGSTIWGSGAVQIICTGLPTITFNAAVPLNSTAIFNPIADGRFPPGYVGSCRTQAPGASVVLVLMRNTAGNTVAAYEGLASGNNRVVFPLIAKRLSNGFATAATIQNLGGAQANVTLVYTSDTGAVTSVSRTIPANGNTVLNQRLATSQGGDPNIPDGWVGSLVVRSDNGQPLGGFVQLTFYDLVPPGDSLQAYNGFSVP